jgi:CRP/FNR family cyclic AMP-dependent transcriptional regulator
MGLSRTAAREARHHSTAFTCRLHIGSDNLLSTARQVLLPAPGLRPPGQRRTAIESLSHNRHNTGRADQALRVGAMMNGTPIDMRQFAKSAGTNIIVKAGNDVFHRGDPGSCMYIVQSGVIEMVIGDKVIETVGVNEAIGFMSMIDTEPRSSTARVKEDCELSVIDQRTFRFMVDEVPNFAMYIMGVLARRIRGMSEVMR